MIRFRSRAFAWLAVDLAGPWLQAPAPLGTCTRTSRCVQGKPVCKDERPSR